MPARLFARVVFRRRWVVLPINEFSLASKTGGKSDAWRRTP